MLNPEITKCLLRLLALPCASWRGSRLVGLDLLRQRVQHQDGACMCITPSSDPGALGQLPLEPAGS